MKINIKLFTTLVAGLIFATASIAQTLSIGVPRSRVPTWKMMSADVTYDTSLLKAVFFFDGLDSSYGALNYELGQIDGLFARPIRLGFAGAARNSNNLWGGPSISYDLIASEKFTVGVVGAFPGLNYNNHKLTWDNSLRFVPGVSMSIRW